MSLNLQSRRRPHLPRGHVQPPKNARDISQEKWSSRSHRSSRVCSRTRVFVIVEVAVLSRVLFQDVLGIRHSRVGPQRDFTSPLAPTTFAERNSHGRNLVDRTVFQTKLISSRVFLLLFRVTSDSLEGEDGEDGEDARRSTACHNKFAHDARFMNSRHYQNETSRLSLEWRADHCLTSQPFNSLLHRPPL
jgi:hypothetical protein